jgi:glycosyltransferase involved in cell wall biosynthesis
MSKDAVAMRTIVFVGNYLPRKCGIATFTTDLCESLAARFPDHTFFAIPVNDTEAGYDYPARVRFELSQNELVSYRQAADFLNINKVDLVCLQHEFGIFGGPEGSHVLSLLRDLRAPVVTTLHTIPSNPNPIQREVLAEIAARSERLVAMSKMGIGFLRQQYGIPEDKVVLVPHGIPDVPFTDSTFYKDHFGVEGKVVILTFGLLGRSKGIENVIKALPEVLEHCPKVVYMVVGATHPNVVRSDGESYRLYLQRLARKLGVEQNVIFYNRFVSLEELVEFIGAADLYVTPYLNREQITSGTLAYALGAGKAIISTPYWYAEDLLADGRGILVPFADHNTLAHAIIHLIEDEAQRHAMRKQAYLLGRNMIWPAVAQEYMRAFEQACQQRAARPRGFFPAKTLAEGHVELPAFNLEHLRRLTDDVGILQHAVGTVPNYSEGYTTDDNARGLILAILLEELGKHRVTQSDALASRYLAFLWHALNTQNGHFRNFMAYDRRWLEEFGSKDSHARALWGIATVLARSRQEGLRRAAARLFELTLPGARQFTDLRPAAISLIAINEYLRQFPGDRAAQETRLILAERLLDAFQKNSADDWVWFEDQLTYANATLPHALLLCGRAMRRPPMEAAGLRALAWLVAVQTSPEGHFVPIGNQGFYSRGATRARFDQQPIEAQTTVSACIAALHLTGERRWKQEALRAFEWFLGGNDVGAALYDPVTGGCCDGLSPQGPSINQGAESTLAFLLSLAELRLLEYVIPAALGQTAGNGQTPPPEEPQPAERLPEVAR